MISIFLMIHWYLMEDTCLLTLIEEKITGRKSSDTFIGRIVKPVYNITSSTIIIITVLLLVFVLCKCIYLKSCCK